MISFQQFPILFLVGATATGKTAVSIELAKRFPIEIINSDSLQVFRHLDIGTAKPTKEIQSQVPHHLIDIMDPDASFTSKEFKELADQKIKEIIGRKKIPLFVGGAGFYLKAISNPISTLPAGTKEINDYKSAYEILVKNDSQSLKKIHPNDHYRISRALFLLDQGIIPSQAFQNHEPEVSPYKITWLGISCERKVLRDQIQTRVVKMFQDGIMDETRNVIKLFPNCKKRLASTIGYRECLEALSSKISNQEALELTATRTKQYAKRQDTWFRKNPSIIWSEYANAVDHFSVPIHDIFRV